MVNQLIISNENAENVFNTSITVSCSMTRYTLQLTNIQQSHLLCFYNYYGLALKLQFFLLNIKLS